MSFPVSTFTTCPPKEWTGRYARITGDRSVFHLQQVAGRWWPIVLWETYEGRAACSAVDCPAARDLAKAVSQAKRAAGGSGGGAFVINEFGQVLVPASDGRGRRYLAGRLNEMFLFENPFSPKEPVNLAANDNFKNGDVWPLPYVGVPYNLHRASKIYFYKQDEDGGQTLHPPKQDVELIQAIRNVRPRGPVRFIVNPAGLVLTRRPSPSSTDPEESWQPVFVGSISIHLWFEKE